MKGNRNLGKTCYMGKPMQLFSLSSADLLHEYNMRFLHGPSLKYTIWHGWRVMGRQLLVTWVYKRQLYG